MLALDPIYEKILRRQNPLELALEGISTFDAENQIFCHFQKNNMLGKKDIASEFIE